MPLNEFIIWVALGALAVGLDKVTTYPVYGVVLCLTGIAGAAYGIREHIRVAKGDWSRTIAALLIVITWAAVGYDIYDRHYTGQVVPTSQNVSAPSPETYLRLQFNAADTMPVAVAKANIFRWYALETIMEGYDEKHRKVAVAGRSWAIYMTFDVPVSIEQVTVDASGASIPRYEVKDSSPRTTVVAIGGDLTGAVLNIRALLLK